MSKYFPKPHGHFDGDISFILDLSNYATKADLKTVPIDLSKLSNVVNNDVVKKMCMIN